MSRVEKFGRSKKREQRNKTKKTPAAKAPASNHVLPPRRDKHPSSNQKVTKWYYNLLFVLFVCLVAALFWYGMKYSE